MQTPSINSWDAVLGSLAVDLAELRWEVNTYNWYHQPAFVGTYLRAFDCAMSAQAAGIDCSRYLAATALAAQLDREAAVSRADDYAAWVAAIEVAYPFAVDVDEAAVSDAW